MVDFQLAITRGRAEGNIIAMLLLEKGEYWRTLGAPDIAVENFAEAMTLVASDSEIATMCRARITQLEGQPGTTFH